jgi:hypothetical protein
MSTRSLALSVAATVVMAPWLVRYNVHETGKDARMSEYGENGANGAHESTPRFEALYRSLLRPAIDQIAQRDVANGADAAEQARGYTERGKPDFALAYLLLADLSDEEKFALYAQSHERRAAYIEQKARQFDRQFARPFPLLFQEAAKDRALARRIRAGQSISPGAGRQLPMM